MRPRKIVSSRVILVTVLAAVLAACARSTDSEEDVPLWVTELIREFEREPVANPPAYVARYEYAGDTVYYVPPRCCDVPGTLYDESGTVICGPDGGLSGDGDGRCPDFASAARNERIIWRDSRRGRSDMFETKQNSDRRMMRQASSHSGVMSQDRAPQTMCA